MEKKHIELPWKLKEGSETLIQAGIIEIRQSVNVLDMVSKEEQGQVIMGLCPANAKFIIRACNSHYALLEALKEAKETIAWMWENFSIDDKNNKSDAFNIPANTISKIEEAIKQCEE